MNISFPNPILSRRSFFLLPLSSIFPQCLSTLHPIEEMPYRVRDPSCLNALLYSLIHAGDPAAALFLFQKMRSSAVPLDSYSFPPVLSACFNLPALGRQIHALMLKAGCISTSIPSTALLNMYSNCSRIEDALSMFDEMPIRDAVAWNALLSSLVCHGRAADAIAAFQSMVGSGVFFTGFTLCSLLKACEELHGLKRGKQIHAWAIVNDYHDLVMATALIDLYSSCALVDVAVDVFNRLECPKDSAIYNALTNGCVKNGRFDEVFVLLVKVKPLSPVMLTSALSACSGSLNLLYGRQIHCVILRHGFDFDAVLYNALMNMYAKCGNLRAVHLVFDWMGKKNVVSWTSIIDAYGSHGRGSEALSLFKRMEDVKGCSNVSPNAVTFLSVLSACSHSGMVDEARECLSLMKDKYGIDPGSEHYACFIDLLGRAGKVEEAWDIFCSLVASNSKPASAICVAMLNACRVTMDLVRGEIVSKHLLESNPDNPSSYIQVSNFYGAFGRWQGVEEFRKEMGNRQLRKEIGNSQVAA